MNLVPALNPKITADLPLVPMQSPQKEKQLRKRFLLGFRSKYLIFGPKKSLKNFLYASGPCYYFQKKLKKPQVVPSTKCGVFRYALARNL